MTYPAAMKWAGLILALWNGWLYVATLDPYRLFLSAVWLLGASVWHIWDR